MRSPYYKQARKPAENIIYGIHPVLEALQAGKELEKIMLARELHTPQVREIVKLSAELEIPVQKVPVEKLDSLTRNNHQGIIAFVSIIEYQPLEDILMSLYEKGENPLLIVLDRVTDVRNMGAIARSAECAGAHALIIPSRGSAQLNADALKTSAGALNTLPVHRSPNLKNTLRYLRDSGLSLLAVTEHGDTTYTQADMQSPLALVMGSEEDGISPEYLKLCNQKITIPMAGTINSLNVSVAAGVVLFEAVRQRSAE